MPRQCTICTHEQRQEIEAAIIADTPLRTIADRWSVSKTALIRHKSEHLPAHLSHAKEAEEEVQATDLLTRLRELNAETLDVLQAAKKLHDHELRLKAVARVERQIELEGRLLGELEAARTVNIIISPEWFSVRAALVRALAPYPDARQSVSAVLLELEAGA